MTCITQVGLLSPVIKNETRFWKSCDSKFVAPIPIHETRSTCAEYYKCSKMNEKISTNGRYTLKRWKNMYLVHISLPSAHTQIHPLVLHMYSTVDWQYALLIPIKLMHKSYHYHKRCHHHIYWRLLWLCDFIFRRKKYKFKPISRSLMSVLVWMEKVFCAYCSWSSSQSLCNNTVSCLVIFKHFTNLCSKILLFDDPKI